MTDEWQGYTGKSVSARGANHPSHYGGTKTIVFATQHGEAVAAHNPGGHSHDQSRHGRGRDAIDRVLREEETGYQFDTMRSDFERRYREAKEGGLDHVTVKVPGGSELSFEIEDVREALGKPKKSARDEWREKMRKKRGLK